jgi:hypothetical protein
MRKLARAAAMLAVAGIALVDPVLAHATASAPAGVGRGR